MWIVASVGVTALVVRLAPIDAIIGEWSEDSSKTDTTWMSVAGKPRVTRKSNKSRSLLGYVGQYVGPPVLK